MTTAVARFTRSPGRRGSFAIAGAFIGVVLVAGCGVARAPSAHHAAVAAPPATSETPGANISPRTHVAPMRRSVPERLLIPAISVDSSLMPLGLKSNGTLETPPGPFPAGWYTGAPTPGEVGPAIIVGHVRFNTPGVFERLTDLRHGDKVLVARKDGSTATFQVTMVQHFAKSRFPTKKVYGNLDHPGLRLITCGGLNASTNAYDENVVVFADLVTRA